MKIVATTSLPAVNRLNADRWNAARSCQLNNFMNTDLKMEKDGMKLKFATFIILSHSAFSGGPNFLQNHMPSFVFI